MKITDQMIAGANKVAGNKDTAGAAKKKKADTSAGASGDRVTVSASKEQIQGIRARLDSIPDVRTEKVAELRSAIEQGTYHPEASEIADAMMREAMFYERGVT